MPHRVERRHPKLDGYEGRLDVDEARLDVYEPAVGRDGVSGLTRLILSHALATSVPLGPSTRHWNSPLSAKTA